MKKEITAIGICITLLIVAIGYWYVDVAKKPQEQNETPTYETPTHQYNVSMVVPVYNRSSRAQKIILKITIEDGTPAVGVNVTYRQITQDFMFGGCLFGWEDPALAKELGINLMGGPNPQAADWVAKIYSQPPPYNFTSEISEWLDHIAFMKNTFNIRYVVRGIGIPSVDWTTGGIVEAGPPPSWANFTDIEGFLKPQWKEYAEAWVSSLHPDLYLIPGAPLAWVDEPEERLEQNWELIKWEINVIKNVDPEVRCGIAISAGWNGSGNPSDTDTIQFLEQMFAAGVDVEVIAVEYHPGIGDCSPNISDMEKYYRELMKFNRDIFIWDACTVSNGSYGYPNPGWYNETWQAEAMSGALKVAFENPLVIGIAYMVFQDYIGSGPNNTNAYWGFVRVDGTPKPSFNQTRDYWRSTFVSGQAVTDENGEIKFTGCPGTYEVIIGDKMYQVGFERPSTVNYTMVYEIRSSVVASQPYSLGQITVNKRLQLTSGQVLVEPQISFICKMLSWFCLMSHKTQRICRQFCKPKFY